MRAETHINREARFLPTRKRVDVSPLGLKLSRIPGVAHYFNPAWLSGDGLSAQDFAADDTWASGIATAFAAPLAINGQPGAAFTRARQAGLRLGQSDQTIDWSVVGVVQITINSANANVATTLWGKDGGGTNALGLQITGDTHLWRILHGRDALAMAPDVPTPGAYVICASVRASDMSARLYVNNPTSPLGSRTLGSVDTIVAPWHVAGIPGTTIAEGIYGVSAMLHRPLHGSADADAYRTFAMQALAVQYGIPLAGV